MAYQALYRQWRPGTFSQMVSQEGIMATLRNQVMTGRIAHAYLFCGSRGTGKTSTAKILSRAINCENPVDGDPCGECDNCKRMQSDASLDIMEIDAASNNGVDEMRDLRDTVKYPPQYGKFKVYIIDEVHMLSTSAFNALLKTLEEPPAHVVFILATTEPQKLPATILSRCQRYDFGRIPVEQIAGRLQEAADAAGRTSTEAALRMIARAAEGGMRDALSILDMCLGTGEDVTEDLVRRTLGTSSREFLFRFSDALQQENAAEVLTLLDELMRSGRDCAVFAREVASHLRSLLMAKVCPDDLQTLLDIGDADAEAFLEQAALLSETRIMSMMELFLNVDSTLRYAASPRIALESAALKACLRTGETDTAALLDRIDALEQQVHDLTEKLKNGVAIAAPAQAAAPKAKAAPKPAAAKPTAPNPGGKAADAVWKQMITNLMRTQPSVASFLAMGRYIGVEDGVYRWEGDPIYVQRLNSEKGRSYIVNALREVCDEECRFEAVPIQKNTPAPAENTENFAEDLRYTFGAERVDVLRDT